MELLIGQQKHGQKKSGLLIGRKWAAEKIHELVQETSAESSVNYWYGLQKIFLSINHNNTCIWLEGLSKIFAIFLMLHKARHLSVT